MSIAKYITFPRAARMASRVEEHETSGHGGPAAVPAAVVSLVSF